MKKTYIIFVVYFLVGILLFVGINTLSPQNLLGYCKTIDMARKCSDLYTRQTTEIGLYSQKERYVDFLIKTGDKTGDTLSTVTIKRKHFLDGERYSVSHSSGVELDSAITWVAQYYRDTGEVYWFSITNLFGKYPSVYWVIFEMDEMNKIDEQTTSYPFTFRNKQYVLYIKGE